MEVLAVQGEEYYQAYFSEKVEETLTNLEKAPQLHPDGGAAATWIKTVTVYSKYVNGNKVQYQATAVEPCKKKYSRENLVGALKEGVRDQLIQNRRPPKGCTLEGRGVHIVVQALDLSEGFLFIRSEMQAFFVPASKPKVS